MLGFDWVFPRAYIFDSLEKVHVIVNVNWQFVTEIQKVSDTLHRSRSVFGLYEKIVHVQILQTRQVRTARVDLLDVVSFVIILPCKYYNKTFRFMYRCQYVMV